MRLIIAGDRNFADKDEMDLAARWIKKQYGITEVVSGCARGADTLGEEWARRWGIPVKQFPADWESHGKAAGPIRNAMMAAYVKHGLPIQESGLLAFLAPESKGTRDMVTIATKTNLDLIVVVGIPKHA